MASTPINNTTALAGGGGVGAALVAVCAALDAKFGFGFSIEFWGAVVGLLFGLPAFGIEFVRYILRLRRLAHGEEIQAEIPSETESVKIDRSRTPS